MVKEYPDFFKVFLVEKDHERMLIPNAFVKLLHSKKTAMPDFILRNHRGRDWYIKALSIGHELYFDDGWKGFKEENYLEDNDYIVFTHVENNVFKFKILELSSMCEKEKVNDKVEKNTKVNGENENEHRHCRSCNPWCIGSSSAAVTKLEDMEIDAEMYIQQGNPFFLTRYVYYRPNELVQFLKYSTLIMSIIISLQTSWFLQYIPKNVSQDLCLCFTKNITLVCCHCKDVEGNEIAAYHHMLPQINTEDIEKRGKIRTWRDGRVFVQGWEDFCRKSKITEKDICLCEFVVQEDGSVEMLRVHVVNDVKE